MEELEAGGFGEVGVVGVEGEGEVGISCVDWVGFRSEVPEGAVVCVADGADVGEEGFGGGGGRGDIRDEGYAVGLELR